MVVQKRSHTKTRGEKLELQLRQSVTEITTEVITRPQSGTSLLDLSFPTSFSLFFLFKSPFFYFLSLKLSVNISWSLINR